MFNTFTRKFAHIKLTVVLMLGLFIFPTTPVHAGAWGEAIAASIMKQTMENISRTIEGALLGTLKVAAVQLLNTQVMQFVGGDGGSQPKIITDFRELLTKTAEQNAEQAVVGDLLTQTLRGKGASANYIANGEVAGLNKGGSYDAYLEKIVRETVAAHKNVEANNFAECSTGGNDPRLAIESGTAGTKAIGCLFNKSANNPIGIALLAEGTYNAEYERTLREQEIKAQSSGFLPGTDKDGNIITPAGSIESLVNDVTTLGNKIIVGADNPGEFLSGVVVSVVNRTVSNLVQKGVGDIQNKIRREIINVDRQIGGELNKVQSVVGPGAAFIDEVNQRTQSVNRTNTGTVPPTTTGP